MTTQTTLDCGHPPDTGPDYEIQGKPAWEFVLHKGKRICHACDSVRLLDCGHHPSPHSPMTTGTAHMPDGKEICWTCADAAQVEQLRDRSRPFVAYVSGDGKSITTWTGGKLMDVRQSWRIPLTRFSYTHGKTILHIRAQDVHGGNWFGRGNPGIAITLRPTKGPAR